jgi:hypothetical protein
MSALSMEDRREGKKTMEERLSAADRVRRRLKAGRPRTIQQAELSPLQAINRLVSEADKARGVMREEGLEAEDIALGLVFYTPEARGYENDVRCRWLPPPGKTHTFFAAIEKIGNNTPTLFMGIVWRLEDRDTGKGASWVTPFKGGPEAEAMLRIARDKLAPKLKELCRLEK